MLILLVIVLFFGSKRIPELARGLGRGMRQFKDATQEIQRDIEKSAGEVGKIKDEVDPTKELKDNLKL